MNSEIIARLQETFNSEDFKSESQQERDDLWREIHRRDARIRQVEADAYERGKVLEELTTHLRDVIRQKDVILKVLCYEIMSQSDKIAPRTFDMAAGMVNALGAGASEFTPDDQELAAQLMLNNLKRFFLSESIQSEISASDEKRNSRKPEKRSGEKAANDK